MAASDSFLLIETKNRKICLSVFPFDFWDGLWVLIWPVPEVFLLLQLACNVYPVTSKRRNDVEPMRRCVMNNINST